MMMMMMMMITNCDIIYIYNKSLDSLFWVSGDIERRRQGGYRKTTARRAQKTMHRKMKEMREGERHRDTAGLIDAFNQRERWLDISCGSSDQIPLSIHLFLLFFLIIDQRGFFVLLLRWFLLYVVMRKRTGCCV